MSLQIRAVLGALLLLTQVAFIESRALGAEAASNPADPQNTLYVELDYGRVVIRMRPDLAPLHVERIKHLVRGGFYDGMVFHRVIAGFMAQTGDPKGNGTGGSGRTIKAEFTRTPQVRGVVSMARTSDKNSGDSQWFIVLADNRDALDGKYTVWGEVTSGMEFVDMIRKGNAGRDGAVAVPDHLVRVQLAADADAAAEPAAGGDVLKGPAAAATARNFSPSEFRCRALSSGPGIPFQSALARLWTHGYMAGFYRAQNKLTFAGDGSNGALNDALAETCKLRPQAFLLSVATLELAKTARALPADTAAFSPASYACKDLVAARAGADPAQADFADLWGFAFIQGFKNVGQPDMELPFAARQTLVGALGAACAKNPDVGFADLAALVAEKVKVK